MNTYEIKIIQKTIEKHRIAYNPECAKNLFDSIDHTYLRENFGLSNFYPTRVDLFECAPLQEGKMFAPRTLISQKTLA